jgi:hypothetical protein
VPWVNLWGSEDVSRLHIDHDPYVGGPGVFLDDSRETEPDFTRQHMGRQRESVIAGRCQVCRRRVPWSRRLLVLAALSVERVSIEGCLVPVVAEPWLCPACARFATTRCPALVRRTRDEALTLVTVRAPSECQIVISSGWIEGPLEARSREVQPAMWAKIVLLKTEILFDATP